MSKKMYALLVIGVAAFSNIYAEKWPSFPNSLQSWSQTSRELNDLVAIDKSQSASIGAQIDQINKSLNSKVDVSSYENDIQKLQGSINQNSGDISNEEVNTMHVVEGGVVSLPSGNENVSYGILNLDQETNKIRAETVGKNVCTPMTGAELANDIGSSSCSDIILWKKDYLIPADVPFLVSTNQRIESGTSMPVNVTLLSGGYLSIRSNDGHMAGLYNINLSVHFLTIVGDATLKNDQITANVGFQEMKEKNIYGGIVVFGKDGYVKLIDSKLIMLPPKGSPEPSPGNQYVGLFQSDPTGFIFLNNFSVVFDPNNTYNETMDFFYVPEHVRNGFSMTNLFANLRSKVFSDRLVHTAGSFSCFGESTDVSASGLPAQRGFFLSKTQSNPASPHDMTITNEGEGLCNQYPY